MTYDCLLGREAWLVGGGGRIVGGGLQVLTEGADHGDVPKKLTRIGILQGSLLNSPKRW